MNIIYAYIALTVISLLILYQVKVWRLRVFLSPGFYFGVVWLFGVLGCVIFSPIGLMLEQYPEYIDELNILVGFTAFCFLLLTPKGHMKINQSPVEMRFCSWRVFKWLSIILFIAALWDFARLGGNLNMAASRQNLHEIQSSRSMLISYATTLATPLSILAGYFIMKILFYGQKISYIKWFFLSLPLLANLIFSINVGGRVDFVYAFINYLLGASLALPLKASLKRLRKPLSLIALGGLVVVIFITVVASKRDEYNSGETPMEIYLKQQSPLLGLLFGPIQYVQSSYIGYQYRRVDAVDENNLGYGKYTFNGFINWTLPFSNLIGLGDASIAKYFDIYYYNQETYDYQREYYYTTHSGYLTLIKDYGNKFSCVIIAILCIISHNLFVGIQSRKKICHATSIFLFYLFCNYWLKMNFYGTLSNTVLIPLYGFLLIDLFAFLFGKK